MSSSINIPTASSATSSRRKLRSDNQPRHQHHLRSMDATLGSPVSSLPMTPSSSASSSSPSSSTASSVYSATPTRIHKSKKGKGVMPPAPPVPPTRIEEKVNQRMSHVRRPSLLGPAIAQEEARVINIGDPDGPQRLISYLTSSQGFEWNPEIFIPSYIDCDYTPLDHRPREPIHEIFLSDEEIEQMFPK
ncbi:uncharacterized protein SPSK_00584 [Sporothrix schenckii 1099-18]|uniref:Uncharacterized protein n=3 Tax=Sporothrix TaxID=29907 RepID=U7Q481_SPOS1|nr:uncharacterized protein SPSK_00584 [Sporothrix schenckii 1099-18]XP_040617041.1 uncharacterized protein SPBR_07742 [Sporothrix brasiliensis 5110]ERT02704.1 hypothetical protein HMPREF1624_01005 [Sporothrix schenckii ATCC 58251]KIH89031.1 hypothetical protein SPBR_07742 [Sporothrix brasiliensis 5110]KJR79984.1 hypothetical protein SPSK_00584 [Sporothrix schenckii 1099-18]